jgi:hypothetical protein
MSEETNNHSSGFIEKFRRRFEANKIAIEGVLFEKEKRKEEKKDYRYWFYFVGAYILNFIINLIYFVKNGDFSLNLNDLKALEYLNNYLGKGILNILKFSVLDHLNFDMPPYYFLYFGFIKILGIPYSFSIFLVNSILIFLVSYGLFYLLLKTRNEKVALTSVLIFLSMPITFDIQRHFSPILLTSVFVLWSYYFYIKSEKLDDARGLHIFVVIYSLGFLSDKFFVIYTLPMIGFINLLLTTVYWEYVVKVFVPLLIISVIFYIRFLMIGLFSISLLDKFEFKLNLGFYLKEFINSFGGIYFYFFIVLFFWMLFARFMVYEPRKIIFKMLIYPLIIISFLPFLNKNYIFPLTLPFIIGSSLMITPYIRKYFNYLTLLIMVINGFSIFALKTYSGITVIGNAKKDQRQEIEVIAKTMRNDIEFERLNKSDDRDRIVSVNLKNDYINYYVLNYLKEKFDLRKVRFVVDNDYFNDFCDYIITDNKIAKSNFKKIHSLKDIHLYKRIFNPVSSIGCVQKCYFDRLNIGNLRFEGVEIELSKNFNSAYNIYDYAVLKAKYSNFKGIDIYIPVLKFYNFSFSSKGSPSVFFFTKVDVLWAKISNFSVSRFFEDNFKELDISFFEDVIVLKKKIFGLDFSYYISLHSKDGVFCFKVERFEIGEVKLPFVNYFANFILDMNKTYLPLNINSVKISKDFIIVK